MNKPTTDELITRYLDDSASDAEMSQLNHLLASSAEARNQFHSATEQAMALVQAVRGPKRSKVVCFPRILGVAACLCILFALAFTLRPEPMATLVSSGGEIELPSGDKIASGDTLVTIGTASFLSFEFRDGTKVHLAGDTIATVTGEGQKRLVVHQGSASLDVTPQPASTPLILMTPTAELTVRGTSFGVFASEGATQLEVTEGAVDLKRLADGQLVTVEAGEYSVASDLKHDFGGKSIPTLTSKWSLDLRQEPEDLLELGVAAIDFNGVTVGARGKPGYGAAEVIASNNAWTMGDYALFRVEKNTVMKVRLKMEHPEWLNFVLNFRSSEPGSTDVVTCIYQDPSLKRGLNPGQWYTVELSLAKPMKYGNYLGNLDEVPVGWSCFSVGASAGNEQRGLVIERIWTE
jgi:ferric-dicitrate binding protein FerR (iron transport regulator)